MNMGEGYYRGMEETYSKRIDELIDERDTLKLKLELMTEDRERWADSACRLEKARDALKADLESVKKAASCYREGAVEGMESFKMASEDRDARKQKAEAEKQRADGNFKSYERARDNYSQMSSKAERLAGALRKIADDWQADQLSKGRAKAALDEYGEGK